MPMLVRTGTSRRPMLTGAPKTAMIRSSSADRAGISLDAVEQDGELVAAQPCRHVGRAHGRVEPPGDGGQQLVAGGVTEMVVDHLEVVQIEIENRDGAAAAADAGDGLVDARAKQRAVRQAGQIVVRGPMGEQSPSGFVQADEPGQTGEHEREQRDRRDADHRDVHRLVEHRAQERNAGCQHRRGSEHRQAPPREPRV